MTAGIIIVSLVLFFMVAGAFHANSETNVRPFSNRYYGHTDMTLDELESMMNDELKQIKEMYENGH